MRILQYQRSYCYSKLKLKFKINCVAPKSLFIKNHNYRKKYIRDFFFQDEVCRIIFLTANTECMLMHSFLGHVKSNCEYQLKPKGHMSAVSQRLNFTYSIISYIVTCTL